MTMVPTLPSWGTEFPVGIRFVAPACATTAGVPDARATIAPPLAITNPNAFRHTPVNHRHDEYSIRESQKSNKPLPYLILSRWSDILRESELSSKRSNAMSSIPANQRFFATTQGKILTL